MRFLKRIAIFLAFTFSFVGFSAPLAQGDANNLSPLISTPVPSNLKPSLLYAKNDRAKPYLDRCHVQQNLISTKAPCIYGNADSNTTIVLFGDSHALSWFPAFEKLAIAKDWKLISLTMSSCWPSDIPAYNPTKNMEMANCEIWRKNTLRLISNIQPDITFIAGTRGFSTLNDMGDEASGVERNQIWHDGMIRTLKSIASSSLRTIYLGDYPISTTDPVACLSKNLTDYSKCATPVAKAIDSDWTITEQSVANESGVEFIDPTYWICKTSPCSPIDGRKLIYLDAGHLTATYAATLEKPLWTAISTVVAN